MADELYRKYHSGRYGNEEKKETSKEKNKVLGFVEKMFKAGENAGKLRDKTKKELEKY